jgi:UDP-N-acetylmuramate--alanine ligase
VNQYTLIYFLGIGGIGMSALARYFNHYKIKVAGYDKTPSTLTDELQQEGINIHFDESLEQLKNKLDSHSKENILVVYTPAVPIDHEEFVYLKQEGYKIKKRAEVLGEITQHFKTIAIAGTHGKTTTSSLMAHIIKHAGYNCYAFLGGITKNYNTNLLLGNDEVSDNTFLVVEADEYDRSFLTLHPDYAVITSVDADHLDIYENEKYMQDSYKLFAQQLKKDGFLLVKKNVDNTLHLNGNTHTYDVSLKADYFAQEIIIENDQFFFDFISRNAELKGISLGIPGKHNVENSVAAIAIALQIGIDSNTIAEALRSFKGVKRRFDIRIKSEKLVYIDDYAHHPEELKAFISSVRGLFPNKKISGIFQPHLFTRTRDFADEFASSLNLLDELILMDIYPAREKPIPNINSQMLLDKVKLYEKEVVKKENLLDVIKLKKIEVLLTMGAGDIDQFCEPIEQLLSAQHEKK